MKHSLIKLFICLMVACSLLATSTTSLAQSQQITHGLPRFAGNPVGANMFGKGAHVENQNIPDWKQVNLDGFGDPTLLATSLEEFNGNLYAGTCNMSGGSALVFRYQGGKHWVPASPPGFGLDAVTGIFDLAVFNGMLYASTGCWGEDIAGIAIFRSADGNHWEQVVSDGFGDPSNAYGGVNFMYEANGWLYATTINFFGGAQIWRSATGNAGDWTQVVSGGFGNPSNDYIYGLVSFKGWLYAAVRDDGGTGSSVWRTRNGTHWVRVGEYGFGNPENFHDINLIVFNDQLYVGFCNTTLGMQVYRTSNGTKWEQVSDNGLGDPMNQTSAFFVYENRLYAVTHGFDFYWFQVWVSDNGSDWQMILADGFGDPWNVIWWNNNIAIFDGTPYLATWNWATGGEVWKMIR